MSLFLFNQLCHDVPAERETIRPTHFEDRGFVLILLSMNNSTYHELKRGKMEHADLAYEIQKVR